MFPKIPALSLVLPARYLDNRPSAVKAREVNNNECRISPSVHALYFYRSSWPFLQILLPSSLSVCLPASLQLVTTAEPDRRLAALAYSLPTLFSAKWKHRLRKEIEEKEDQNKIILMLGLFFFVVAVTFLITQLKSSSFSSPLHPSTPSFRLSFSNFSIIKAP